MHQLLSGLTLAPPRRSEGRAAAFGPPILVIGASGHTEPAAVSDRAQMPAARKSRRGTVLLAEDDEMVSTLIVFALEQAGYAVIATASGEEAFAAISAGARFDILLTDVRMPGTTDGWLLAEKARERYPDLPVIYASAYSPKRARFLEGSAFLAKPFRIHQLLEIVDRIAAEAARRPS